MVKSITKEADLVDEASISSVSSALEEVGVNLVHITWAESLESWVQGLDSQVDNLSRRNRYGDLQLLDSLAYSKCLSLTEIFVDCHGGAIEVRFFQEVAERNKKHAVVSLSVTSLLEQCWRPSRVLVAPWSIVAFSGPWISHFSEPSSLKNNDVKQGIGMRVLQSIWGCSTISVAAANHHWIVISRHLVEQVKIFFFLVDNFCVLEEEGWLVGQHSQTLESWTSLDSFVIAVQLRVGFLEQRHPPSFVGRSACGKSREVIFRVRVLVPNWESVVDVDRNPFLLYPEEVSEDTSLRIVLTRVIVNDLVQSFWILSKCGHSCQEPAITEATLLNASGGEQTLGAFEVNLLTRVNVLGSLPSNDSLV